MARHKPPQASCLGLAHLERSTPIWAPDRLDVGRGVALDSPVQTHQHVPQRRSGMDDSASKLALVVEQE